MKRSVLLSIMFIAGALGIIAFSAAQFTDYESTKSDPIQSGTLDLGVVTDIDCTFPADGLEGGPSTPVGEAQASCPFVLHNTGSLLGTDLYAKITVEDFACMDGDGLQDTSEFCDSGKDLTPAQFDLKEFSLTPGPSNYPTTSAPLSANIDECRLFFTDVPIDTNMNGKLTVELVQTRISNAMQGDAIRITLHFELAEDGATGIDCAENAKTSTTAS